jgi:formylmethanofuran dehydrogenase subunit E
MNKKDPNYIAALEKAIKEKYGELATMNPKMFWDPDKEKQYLEESKLTNKQQLNNENSREKVDIGGVLIPKKLISKNINKNCTVCKEYSFNKKDDVYLNKFSSCYKCYIKFIEDREERWLSGWRPKEENING